MAKTNRGNRSGAGIPKQRPAEGAANPLTNLSQDERQKIIAAEIIAHPSLLQKPAMRDALKIVVQQSAYQGPVPPAEMYAAYEQADAGSGRLLIDMAKIAMQGQIAHNEARLDGDLAEARLGQIFAFIISMTALIAGAYVAIHGAQWPGAILGVGGLAAIVYQFIQGKKRQ